MNCVVSCQKLRNALVMGSYDHRSGVGRDLRIGCEDQPPHLTEEGPESLRGKGTCPKLLRSGDDRGKI